MEILLATNNQHKILEYQKLFKDLNIKLYTLKDLNINCDPLENGSSFKENSLIKAKEIAKYTNLCILSDDSGLTLKALPNILGIYSHRFLENKSYFDKCNEVIRLLENKEKDAYFSCVITLYNFKGQTYQFEGIVNGKIASSYKGNNGFGYDPIFIPKGYDKTFAELEPNIKNKISHRGIATGKLLSFLNENS